MSWIKKIELKMFEDPKDKKYREFCTSFNGLSEGQAYHIDNVIKVEMRDFEKKFGSRLRDWDKYEEATIIMSIFNIYGQTLVEAGKEKSPEKNNNYIHRYVDMVMNILKANVEYYRENTPRRKPKDIYDRHLKTTVERLLSDFLSNSIQVDVNYHSSF